MSHLSYKYQHQWYYHLNHMKPQMKLLNETLTFLTNVNLHKRQPACRFAQVSTSVAVSFSRLLGQHSSEPKL